MRPFGGWLVKGVVALAGSLTFGASGQHGIPPSSTTAPFLETDALGDAYASSRACRACHPKEYDTWYGSYHRTMTQWAGRDSVQAPWNVTLEDEGRQYRLFRDEDGGFWIDMPRYGTEGRHPGERFDGHVVLTTGSHHMQYYWLRAPWVDDPRAPQGAAIFSELCADCHESGGGSSGPVLSDSLPRPEDLFALESTQTHHAVLAPLDAESQSALRVHWERLRFPGGLVAFPFVYFLRDGEWLRDRDTFLNPSEPRSRTEPYGKHWSDNCDGCHTTVPSFDPDFRDGIGRTRAVELGISCETCHGPGRAHVEARRNPVLRYREHLTEQLPADIVNPARLSGARASSICAQCHAESLAREGGDEFSPGQHIEETAHILRQPRGETPRWLRDALQEDPDALRNAMWADGTIRIAGRDYNGLVESACFQRGDLSCITCHTMHGEEPNDQLRPEASGDRDTPCTSCHESVGRDVTGHTNHRIDSSGSRCVNCHMPRTTWGLLGAIRAHRVDSPNVAKTLATGRPTACNLCHLDFTLSETASSLEEWFGQTEAEVSELHRTTAASIVWLLSGDAVQRGIAAWHMGWEEALGVSGSSWQAPFLARALDDPYSAVRYAAGRSLGRMDGFSSMDFDLDLAQPRGQRRKTMLHVLSRWQLRPGAAELSRPELLILRGATMDDVVEELLERRNDVPIVVAE